MPQPTSHVTSADVGARRPPSGDRRTAVGTDPPTLPQVSRRPHTSHLGYDAEPWLRTWVDRPTLDSLVMSIVGDLDAVSAPYLETLLRPHTSTRGLRVLVLDLSRVAFIGVAGLQGLVDVDIRARSVGIELRIVMGSRCVTRAMEITGLRHEFMCCPDVDAAVMRF